MTPIVPFGVAEKSPKKLVLPDSDDESGSPAPSDASTEKPVREAARKARKSMKRPCIEEGKDKFISVGR